MSDTLRYTLTYKYNFIVTHDSNFNYFLCRKTTFQSHSQLARLYTTCAQKV